MVKRALVTLISVGAGFAVSAAIACAPALASGNAWGCSPSADPLFCTLAQGYGGLAIGNEPTNGGMYASAGPVQGVPGGYVLSGNLTHQCAWGQSAGDFVSFNSNGSAPCPSYDPFYANSQFIFAAGHYLWGNPNNPDDGDPMYYSPNCGYNGVTDCYSGTCSEWANFLPWAPGQVANNNLRNTTGENIFVRYLTAYTDTSGNIYYMVRDGTAGVGHGDGNWVFLRITSFNCFFDPPAANQLVVTRY